jgi:hypothetical protein
MKSCPTSVLSFSSLMDDEVGGRRRAGVGVGGSHILPPQEIAFAKMCMMQADFQLTRLKMLSGTCPPRKYSRSPYFAI